MREFTLATTIAAPPDDVWDVLADFERYPQWHPVVERLAVETDWSTQLKLVLRITSRVRLKGSLLEFDPPRRVQWNGAHRVWGLIRPTYTVELTPAIGGETVLVQRLKVGGLLPRFRPGTLNSLPDALAESADAVKQLVEGAPQLRAA